MKSALQRVGRLAVVVGAAWLVAVGLHAGETTPPPEPPLPPTHAGVAYGEQHARQTLELWLPKPEAGGKSAPVVVVIHGGGWLHGSGMGAVAGAYKKRLVKWLGQGYAVAAVNYRYSTQAPLPAPVRDVARAVQFLRAHAEEYSLDPARIAAVGDSAGGCTALWLAVHDDLADPNSPDPVARQSSRVSGAAGLSAQTTLEPEVIRAKVVPSALSHAMFHRAGGFGSNAEMEKRYPEVAQLYRDYSPVLLLDAKDPPTFVSYAGGLDDDKDGVHHARFGLLFKERADEVGAKCYVNFRKAPDRFKADRMDLEPFIDMVLASTR